MGDAGGACAFRGNRAGLRASIIAAALLVALPASARWATKDDAPYAMNFENAHYEVSSDGSYRITYERQIEILKESARSSQGLTRVTYNSRASKLKIIEAKTINGDKIHRVEDSMIEIKPLASVGQGFDQVDQVTIAFPEVAVGSKLYLKYVRDDHEKLIPNFFFATDYIGWNELIQDHRVEIDSELPLYWQKNDPEDRLEVQEGKRGSKHHLEMRLKAPLYRAIFEEPSSAMPPGMVTRIDVTTEKEWGKFVEPIIQNYEKVINSPLPESYRKIVEAAKKKENVVDRINTAMSMLADTIRYVGDWRPVEGAYNPRPLEVIARTQYGDCKDFSVSTAALLRGLGIEAYSAWVTREHNPVLNPNHRLPLPEFNHAITTARVDGKVLWLDGTNFQSYAQGIFDDIVDRPALVLYPSKPSLEQIPPARSSDSRIGVTLELGLGREENHGKGKISLSGRAGLGMTGSNLLHSKQSLEYTLVSWLLDESKLISWSSDDFNLSSRVVRDLDFPFRFEERNVRFKTSAGPAYLIPLPYAMNQFRFRREERVSDFLIGAPMTWKRQYKLRNISLIGSARMDCRADTPWVDFRRSSRVEDGGVTVTDQLELKRSRVSNDELKTPEFQKLQERIRDCFEDAAVVYRLRNTSSPSGKEKP